MVQGKGLPKCFAHFYNTRLTLSLSVRDSQLIWHPQVDLISGHKIHKTVSASSPALPVQQADRTPASPVQVG